MLTEFTVGNYRSFKEPQTLSMVAARVVSKDKRLDEENVFEVNGVKLLKSAAVYGPNSSGKSNLVKAFNFVRHFVTRFRAARDADVNEPIRIEPFLLDDASARQPSFFEVVFIADGKQYRYGFEAVPERVVSEWLFHVPQQRESMLFMRKGADYELQGAFKQEGAGLEKRTRENRLFLPVVAEFNGSISRAILSWFGSLRIDSGIMERERFLTERMLGDEQAKPEQRQMVLDLLRGLNLGFDDVVVERTLREEPDIIATRSRLPGNAATDDPSDRSVARRAVYGERISTRTVHRKNDTNEPVQFDLDSQESDGTRRVFALAGKLVDALTRGRVMIVDEMDARLHPILTRNMVQLFNSTQTNPRNAQLVFATHDTNLLNNRLFRRDQIWFVEKDQQQASRLYSLVKFKGVRYDASYEKDYILGRYGAIPFLGDLRDLVSPPGNGQPEASQDNSPDAVK